MTRLRWSEALLALGPFTHWVKRHPASDGLLACRDSTELAMLRWIQAQPIWSAQGANFGETGQNRSIPMECGPNVDQVTRQSDAR